MRTIKPIVWLDRLSRLLTFFSVRTRVIALALIPVAGFLANGLTYVSGENAVGTAFSTVKRSSALADASRDFKSAVASMRLTVKDFSVSPNNNLVVDFERAHMVALNSLDTIANSFDRAKPGNIVGLRNDVMKLRENFDELVREQETLGFDENTGLRRNLRDAGNAVERILNTNMSWLADTDAAKLMMALLVMRHHEADYRLNPMEITRQQFLAAYKQFNDLF